MSISYKKGNVIGEPIDTSVSDQIKARANKLKSKNNRTDKDLMYLNSTTGWVKLSSSVNTPDGKEQDAKNFTLLGGVLRDTKQLGGIFNSADNAYKNSKMLGYRPMAGITSFDVDTPSTFGVLRTASVNFKANSIEDLDILEQLYMRPGFSILLEWGHSLYIDNKGDLQTNIKTFPNFFNNSDANSIYEKIKELKEGSYNNYDAMYGFIKNFVWSYNLDGGYDCKVDIVAQGEIIQSIQVALAGNNTKNVQETGVYTEGNFTTKLHEVLHLIQNAAKEDILSSAIGFYGVGIVAFEVESKLTDKTPDVYSTVVNELKSNNRGYGALDILAVKISGDKPGIIQQWTKYITLGTLLEFFNKIFTIKDQKGNPFGKFHTDRVNSFLTFPQHFALDPKIAVLPKPSGSQKIFGYNISSQIVPFNGEYSDILNIWINVEYILDLLNRSLETKEITVQTLTDILNTLLRELSSTLGGINEFDIHNNGEDNAFYIVDRKVTPGKEHLSEVSKLDLVGLGSSLENLTMASKLSANTTSMIAIASMAASSNIGKDTLNIQKWSLGLTDRHAPTKTVGIQPLPITGGDPLDEIDKYRLEKYCKSVNPSKPDDLTNFIGYNSENITGITPLHRQFTVACVEFLTKKENKSPGGLIPFELGFTMQGIGGIKVGQSIVVNDSILPKRYRGEVAFIVTGVAHTIQNNRWVTTVKTQMQTIGTFGTNAVTGTIKGGVSLEEELAREYIPFTSTVNSDIRQPLSAYPRIGVNGVTLIKSFERLEINAYPDPVSKGIPITIGYGATRGLKGEPISMGTVITPQAAEVLLARDLDQKVTAVKRLVKVPLTLNEFDAIVSFTYNVGEGNLQESTLLSKLNSKDYIGAADQFMAWDGKGDISIPGLVRRRLQEKTLFLKDNPGNPV